MEFAKGASHWRLPTALPPPSVHEHKLSSPGACSTCPWITPNRPTGWTLLKRSPPVYSNCSAAFYVLNL